jgi:hypothetical protein
VERGTGKGKGMGVGVSERRGLASYTRGMAAGVVGPRRRRTAAKNGYTMHASVQGAGSVDRRMQRASASSARSIAHTIARPRLDRGQPPKNEVVGILNVSLPIQRAALRGDTRTVLRGAKLAHGSSQTLQRGRHEKTTPSNK